MDATNIYAPLPIQKEHVTSSRRDLPTPPLNLEVLNTNSYGFDQTEVIINPDLSILNKITPSISEYEDF